MSNKYPTSHVEECEREPDLSLQQYYELILRALALNDQREFERLISNYVIADIGAYRKKRAKDYQAALLVVVFIVNHLNF